MASLPNSTQIIDDVTTHPGIECNADPFLTFCCWHLTISLIPCVQQTTLIPSSERPDRWLSDEICVVSMEPEHTLHSMFTDEVSTADDVAAASAPFSSSSSSSSSSVAMM